MKAVHVIVHGRVQGVWFRASTKDEADRLGVRGWVRNRPDGSVEAYAVAPPDALAAFLDWIGHGPRLAHVERLETQDAQPQDLSSFDIRR